METMNKNITYTYYKSELIEKITETINIIQKWVLKNDYRINGNLEIYKIQNFDWKYNSRKSLKKTQRYCFWINKKPTLKRVNSFLNHLSKSFGIDKVHVKISLKEEMIQKSKKEWIKARKESERLLKIYKEEKSNFYKINFFS